MYCTSLSIASLMQAASADSLPGIVCFDLNPARVQQGVLQYDGAVVMYGDGANAELIRASGAQCTLLAMGAFGCSLHLPQAIACSAFVC